MVTPEKRLNYPAKTLLTVYYREGCHLCEQMTASLRWLQAELAESPAAFEFERIDIDRDAELRERYNVDVPVVVCGGEVICFHFFEEDMIRTALSGN